MDRDGILGSFRSDLGTRAGAAAVVVGIFGLGYVNRTDFLGLSSVLDSRLVFFAVSFLLLGLVGPGWTALQQYGG